MEERICETDEFLFWSKIKGALDISRSIALTDTLSLNVVRTWLAYSHHVAAPSYF